MIIRVLFVWCLLFLGQLSIAQNPTEIVRKAYSLMQGSSNESVMTMSIVRPTWTRSITFKTWSKGNDFSLALVTDPARERGQAFLKRKNEIWNWVPSIGRMVKLPASMMSQGWMGSDYSNDDLLKESSIVNDYTHSLLGIENIGSTECYKIKLVPTEKAAVVWGSIVKWISKDDYFQLRSDFYDEDNQLVKTETASNIKQMDDRRIPTHFEIIPTDKPGNKTIMEISSSKFNLNIGESFFSQQNMKKISAGN